MTILDIKEKTLPVNVRWGNRMPLMACEECGELIQAVSKLERKLFVHKSFDDEYDHLIEEIGDVFLTMGALMNRYCISAIDIEKAIDSKLSEERTV